MADLFSEQHAYELKHAKHYFLADSQYIYKQFFKRKKGGFKGRMLFRAIEKTGSLVGMRDPFEKDFRYPFHIVAVKQAQLVALSAKALLEVFAMDNRSDIEGICEVLEKEFNDISQALVKGQDPTAGRRSSRPPRIRTRRTRPTTASARRRRRSGPRGSQLAVLASVDGVEATR